MAAKKVWKTAGHLAYSRGAGALAKAKKAAVGAMNGDTFLVEDERGNVHTVESHGGYRFTVHKGITIPKV